MKKTHYDSIYSLLKASRNFQSNDLLVQLNPDKVFTYREELPLAEVQKIIRDARTTWKESGVNPLCFVSKFVHLEEVKRSPLFLTPVAFQINRAKKSVQLSTQLEDWCLNPYLAQYFSSVGIELENAVTQEGVEQKLLENDIHLEEKEGCVGNFHHHRYSILKELEELLEKEKPNVSLATLLGVSSEKKASIDLSEKLLLPADCDHRKAFPVFQEKDIVIQGPPGTGKSQILTNFIGKLLGTGQNTLICSEKRAALEVIYARLQSANLDSITYISSGNVKDFYAQLEGTWNFFLNYEPQHGSKFSVRKEVEDNLQLHLDILNQPAIISGVSYTFFHKNYSSFVQEDYQHTSKIPNLEKLHEKLPWVKTVYAEHLTEIIGQIKPIVFQKDLLPTVSKKIPSWVDFAKYLYKKHGTTTLYDLQELVKKSAVCQIFENEIAKRYAQILEPNSKKRQQFEKKFLQQQQLNSKLEALKTNLKNWKNLPSKLELEELLQLSKKKDWLTKLRFRRKWKKVSVLSGSKANSAIKEGLNYRKVQQQIERTKQGFYRLGIATISEIDTIHASLPLFTPSKWYFYTALTSEEKEELLRLPDGIGSFSRDVNLYFYGRKDTFTVDFLLGVQENIPQLLEQQEMLKSLSIAEHYNIGRYARYADFMQGIASSAWQDFRKNHLNIADFNPNSILQKVERALREQEVEAKELGNAILLSIKEKFDAYHTLLTTPAAKLNKSDKTLKKELRKGKSILVKEFAKTRSHPSVRTIYSSEARKWIKLLLPIWMSNPVELGKNFPLEANLFEACIMDEASQMPLQNSLGAVYRSKRLIVAGDDQQMAPSFYFQAQSEEVVSTLHQANFHLECVHLNHHYRSKHPQLIAFSNKHFYKNALRTFPSFPPSSQAIERHFLENASYANRRNVEEARRVNSLLRQILQEDKSIGVVAFSEEQVNCISENLDASVEEQLMTKIDANQAFLKPLEKVQGDECDVLIISFGFGKKSDGQFHLKFGPVNHESGRNRLNVLFSRASEKIHFITSVTAADFKLSDNESINTLRNWFLFVEKTQASSAVQFPTNLHPKVNNQILTFEYIHEQLPNAIDMITSYTVLKSRGWKVELA